MPTINCLDFGTGLAGQYLISNGLGVAPTFQNFAGFSQVIIRIFTSSGTYTPTSHMKFCIIEVIGGGGGGGGVAGSATLSGAGSGGGGGGASRKILTASQVGSSKTFVIGAAGAGGTSGTSFFGSNGGGTSFGSGLVSTTGGAGGFGVPTPAIKGSTVSPTPGQGTSAAVAFNSAGAGLLGAYYTSTIAVSGSGGMCAYSAGGAPENALVSAGVAAGANSSSFGGGGSAAAMIATNTSQNGGNGSAGLIIVTEFI